MEFSVEAAGPCRKRVKVTIPPELVAAEFDKSYRQWIRTVPIPGFRPGKAPRKLVEKRFGKQVALEVKQTLLDSAFDEALKENNLSPITDPELDIEKVEVDPGQAVDFDFLVTVKPEFDLPDYEEIEVAVPPAAPTPEELDHALRALRKSKATLRPVKKGTIKTEDVVSLKVRGLAGEKELFHHENLPYEVGSRMLADLLTNGLDEALEGKKVGAAVEAKAFAPPYAENHPLAGVDLELHAEVLDLKRPDLPELDDKFAALFDFDRTEELVEVVTKDVRNQKERERERMIEDLALAQIVEKSDFELPEGLIEREADELARRAALELQMQGKSEEEIAKQVARIRQRRTEESARELKAFFVLDKIVDQERILVTETEVQEAVAQVAAYHDKAPDQMYTMLRDAGRLASLRNQLRVKKARAKLRNKVLVTDAPARKPAAKKGKATKKES
ncbi:MAG: trigger factor [Planctomycetota bacterium]|jgi:trigger factor